jgi:hypothetical protein
MKGIHVFPDESGKLVRVISRQCSVRLPKHAKCFEILNIGGTGDGEGGAPKPKYTVNISNHSSVVGACLTHKQFLTTDNLESQIRNLIQCKINDCTPERSKELHNQTDSLTH